MKFDLYSYLLGLLSAVIIISLMIVLSDVSNNKIFAYKIKNSDILSGQMHFEEFTRRCLGLKDFEFRALVDKDNYLAYKCENAEKLVIIDKNSVFTIEK